MTTTKSAPASSPPIATAVDEDGTPDRRAATKLARFLLDNGCDGFNVLGTTGEATSFSARRAQGLMSAYATRACRWSV